MRCSSIAAFVALCTASVAQSASAAEMPFKAPPSVAVYNWTGFYVGGNAGYGWGDANEAMILGGLWLTDGTGDNVPLTPLGNGQLKPDGFTGGIQAGFNYQIDRWVFGLEADANFLGLKDDFSRAITNPRSGNSYRFTSSFEGNWLATVRPRLGYAFDRVLVYATGGLAIANQRFFQDITQLNVVFNESRSLSKTTAGWTVGAGAEYALVNHWSLKAEYLFVDPGSVLFSTAGTAPDTGYVGVHSAHLKANIVRAGVNYHFNN